MSKTLIGIVSYGGLPFLELCLRSIQETTDKVDVMVVVAKSGDDEMANFLRVRGVPLLIHSTNQGFPASVNDLLDTAFVSGFSETIYRRFNFGDYDNLLIIGNDVVAMPGAIDAMIHTAETTDYEMVCGSEFNSRFLVNNYPEARQFFHGDNLIFNDFTARPWELHKERRSGIEPHARKDIRNFTLFKRSAFEKVGYADANFWPNGYAEDNDACLRLHKSGVSACGLLDAPFFHFWSRTIHQNAERDHGKYFTRNMGHYVHKWGGPVGGERYDQPYDGRGFQLSPEIFLAPDMKISSREQEAAIIDYWSRL
jgi:GT2 family glycosyltransferase